MTSNRAFALHVDADMHRKRENLYTLAELRMQQLGPDNAIWDDGEWISWDEINEQIQYKEWRAKYPNADLSLVTIFENLIGTAEDYHLHTGKHLQVYGDIGELYGAITHGISCTATTLKDRTDGSAMTWSRSRQSHHSRAMTGSR